MAAPIKNQTCHQSSPWSTVLNSHRTLVISERLSKSAGFIDSSQSIISSGMIFFFDVSPLTGVSYSRQSPKYPWAPPSRPAQATASRSYPEDYICHDDISPQVLAAARTCCLPGFYFFDFYPGGVLFVHPRLYPHPYPKGTRPYPHRPITTACLSANHNGPFMS